jgi:hypothetical protein
MRKAKRKNIATVFTATLLLPILITGCRLDKKVEEPVLSKTAVVTDLSENEVTDPMEEEYVYTDETATSEESESTPEPIEATETSAPTEEPKFTEKPVLTPAPAEEPASTPAPAEEPAPTPVPTKKPEHVHNWSNATCTSPKTCACGETSGSKLGHDFGNNNKNCFRCGTSNPNYVAPHSHRYNSVVTQATCANDGQIIYTCSCGDTYTETIPATGVHVYGYGEINCRYCGTPHTHDWNIVVQTNSGVEITPDEDFCCHSGWYFDTYEELRAHMDIPNVHGMIYLNDGSNGVTSVPRDYVGHVDFYACCHGWANCAGDGEGERIEYEITQEVQFCKLCGVRGEAKDIGPRVILLHTIDD